MTEPAVQYEPKQLSIFVHKATYCAFEREKKKFRDENKSETKIKNQHIEYTT